MIRDATHDDLAALLPLTEAFHKATQLHLYRPWNEDQWSRWLTSCIDSNGLTCIVFDSDGIKGLVTVVTTPAFFDDTVKVAQENVLWVDPDACGAGVGRALVKAAVEFAEAEGCMVVGMGTSKVAHPKKLGRLLRSEGFKVAEEAFSRRVG